MSVMVTKATPLPSITKMRAEPWGLALMTEHKKVISRCMYCKTQYRNAGAAWVWEHYHCPLP
jgi:hypothetical protein